MTIPSFLAFVLVNVIMRLLAMKRTTGSGYYKKRRFIMQESYRRVTLI